MGERGLLDTSILVVSDASPLLGQMAISFVSLAELLGRPRGSGDNVNSRVREDG